ncbi:MAG: indolepyruvate oxidoreductase subunit beta, partial [Peptostreptococcaceae bacterium]|nr:indolepyruvate oxidoreductase subunit beta [Peptostreptococcaceae bacterium]
EVFSPVIEKGEADLLVSFEKMEALRWLEYLRPGGKVVVNDHEINPMPVIMGMQEYSENILEEICNAAPTKVINATKEADKLGNGKVMNMILLGATVKLMGLENINWKKIIKENVKPSFFDINVKAFEAGYALC